MKLSVFLPTGIFMEEEVVKVIGEGPQGEFCLLPRHIDYVTALIPGLFSFFSSQTAETFLALNHGVLVKKGDQVLVSTLWAVKAPLGELQQEVEKMTDTLDEKERLTRSSVAKLEAGFIRRFVTFGKGG